MAPSRVLYVWLGLVSLGAGLGPQVMISGRILASFAGSASCRVRICRRSFVNVGRSCRKEGVTRKAMEAYDVEITCLFRGLVVFSSGFLAFSGGLVAISGGLVVCSGGLVVISGGLVVFGGGLRQTP